MSNTYESDNQRDNEQKKFQADSAGDTAVNVTSKDLAKQTGSLLEGVVFDAIVASYPTSSSEVYEYKTGGVSGTLNATITVTYTNSTKDLISSVVKT